MIGNISIIFISILPAVVSGAFTPFLSHQTSSGYRQSPSTTKTRLYNVFDDLKLIFSEEGRKNRAAYTEREKEEQWRAQQEIFERRNNPSKMDEYNQKVRERRADLNDEREVWKFQQRSDGGDPLEDWNRLREEGTIQVGSDLERDESSKRLGSEGLNDVRTDERLPYIDQGYVDDDADFMGNIMGMFGGSKKKKETEE